MNVKQVALAIRLPGEVARQTVSALASATAEDILDDLPMGNTSLPGGVLQKERQRTNFDTNDLLIECVE
jgi:hypothetical protein